MILFPAIDLFGGNVVRLKEGNFDKKSNYNVTALSMAKQFRDAGCKYIHIVDLEGAKCGYPCHLNVLEEISKMGMTVQYGGGLRSEEAIADAIEAGATRVMVGSMLFRSDDMPQRLFDQFGTHIVPSVDIKNGYVVHSGWLESTQIIASEAISNFVQIGYNSFLVTDTERDGMMRGARTNLYKPLIGNGYTIIAAGGITGQEDILALGHTGVAGVVIGKSLYEGGITLAEALKTAREA